MLRLAFRSLPTAPVWSLGAALLAILVWVACDGSRPAVRLPESPRVSLLAVGDTGLPPEEDVDGVLQSVALGLAAEDERIPANTLVLLGDNFYPRGLLQSELVPRVRENIVRPFCRFLRLDGPRSHEVRDACPRRPAERNPVPIHAVLGNHDYQSDESPRLQRLVVPAFVPVFRLAGSPTEVVELPGGLSLVLVDSQKVFHRPEERTPFLTDALKNAQGPWIVVAAHHPPRLLRADSDDARWMERATPVVVRAIESSGRTVHVWLAGHEHNLQLLVGEAGEPSLIAVAGSGSDPRRVRTRGPAIATSKSPGFARVDLVEHDGVESLVVTLFEVDPERPQAPHPLAQASVLASGALAE